MPWWLYLGIAVAVLYACFIFFIVQRYRGSRRRERNLDPGGGGRWPRTRL